MEEKKLDEAQTAFYRATARQLSPFIREMFTNFAEENKVEVYDCYCVMRFRDADKMDDENNQIMEMRIFGRSDIIEDQFAAARAEIHKEDIELIKTMMPMFKGDMQGHAQYLQVPITHMYIRVKLLQTNEPGVDKTDLALRCSSRKEYVIPFFSDTL